MTKANEIRLLFTSGTTRLDPIRIEPPGRRVIGRSSTADIVLEDEAASLSRKHIEFFFEDDAWRVRDLGSRNGTTLNGSPLKGQEAAIIEHGSILLLGNWELLVLTDDFAEANRQEQSTLVPLGDDGLDSNEFFERVPGEPLAHLASHRLATLLECSDSIHACESLSQAGRVALDAMLRSTGYSRGAFVRICDDGSTLETLAFQSRDPKETIDSVRFSQSLLSGAREGDVVRLTKSSGTKDYGQSIAELDIHSALCIPVSTGDNTVGYLYLDARGSEHLVSQDSTAFGRAIGNLLASVATNLINKELEIERVAMQYDLDAAGRAQRMLLPEPEGVVGNLGYTMSMRPGRHVAGDLFGVVSLDGGRVCVFLGDVSGKGAGAAIMMATTQSYLHAMLEETNDLAVVMNRLNHHIAHRSYGGMFVTMWIGMFSPQDDAGRSEITFVDAGHGHWMLTNPDRASTQPEYKGGVVLGIAPDYQYMPESFHLDSDQRLVLFSDGIVEQTGPDGDEEHGIDRVRSLLRQSVSTKEDVEQLLQAVIAYAQSEQLDDDTTVASIGLV
ncbi:MAG: SpoIIE family protein phosphatase [Phycisphaerales bacterium]